MGPTTLTPPPDGDVILSNHYIIGIIVMTVLAVLIAWLRMYTRIFVSGNTGWDDWTMFTASIVTVVTNAFLMNSYRHGIGRHMYYLEPDQISQTFKWLWAAEPTNLFAVFLVRLSISLFFLRLVPRKKIYLRLIWGIITALIISDVFVTIYYFFQCRPLRKVWEPATPGSCFGQGVTAAALWLYQAVSILADIFLLIIPVSLFWRLQVPTRTKLALMFICCLGVFTCVCAIVKTALLTNFFSSKPDKTWIYAQLCLWAPMELCVGMICGTIPALRPLTASRTKVPREQGYYERFGSPNKLAPNGNERTNGSSRFIPFFPTNKAKLPEPLPSTSQERFMGAYDLKEIRRTVEVEISNEAGASTDEGKGAHKHDWNPV
ncbi:hypothetical protein IMSHALPRED_005218 [Imshaugia aleurites]|uniref:Rhodopsin domain-containing protein n=1 Tax=Imshaugia aleurites TaxID=172621 RepID=A0A8H3FAA3_9LECA|nr:hypothetical protein IMSHALPRED_005218 [Imshaugia aleurites]